MSKKVLVSQEFHRKALIALEKQKSMEMEDSELVWKLRNAWINYMEEHCTEEQSDHFADYCEEYLVLFES
ncbi:hypothetical protein VP193E371_P0024 [Vibrio phage 193E37-1]|nr:hypothetical protein VP193E371_P0024 [Vibrio phage 193E37-1]